ncbi:MAG: hypothetical protein AAF666_18710, partial [Pseudomonadota bacterium]
CATQRDSLEVSFPTHRTSTSANLRFKASIRVVLRRLAIAGNPFWGAVSGTRRWRGLFREAPNFLWDVPGRRGFSASGEEFLGWVVSLAQLWRGEYFFVDQPSLKATSG